MSKITAEKWRSAKLEGVFARGYGVVPRLVMTDSTLTPEAKLLYAYFCVVSGNDGGYQDCPSEEMILSTLQISHTRYLRHRKSLIEAGYIDFIQPRSSTQGGKQLYGSARFILVKSSYAESYADSDVKYVHPNLEMAETKPASASPHSVGARIARPHSAAVIGGTGDGPEPKVEPSPSGWTPSGWTPSGGPIVQEGIFSAGFGLLPRLPLFDRSLSIEAKAAYAFLCVYANAATRGERIADVRAALIADKLMSRKRAQHAIQELIRHGYVKRLRQSGGPFSGNRYILCLHPEPEGENDTAERLLPEVDFDTTEKMQILSKPGEVSLPDTSIIQCQFETTEPENVQARFATTQNKTAQNDMAQNATAIINNTERITISTNNSPSISPSPNRQADVNIGAILARVEAQIEADILHEIYDADLIDGIVLEIARTFTMGDDETMRIDGRQVSAAEVKLLYRRLRFAHIEHVIRALKESAAMELRNPQAYLRACLYNAPITLGLQDLLSINQL